MANSPKDPSSITPVTPPGKKPEMSMEIRLLISFVLMGVVLFVSPYIMKNVMPAPAPAPAPVEKKAETKATPAAEAVKPAEPARDAATAGQIAGDKPDDAIIIDNGVYRVTFSNRGGVVRNWVLPKHLDANRKAVDLVNGAAPAKVGYPFSVRPTGGATLPADPNQKLYAVKRSEDGMRVEFEFSDGVIYSRKSFQFRQGQNIVDLHSELRQGANTIAHFLDWRGGFGDFTAVNALSTQHTLHFDAANNKLVVSEVKEARDGPVTVTARMNFAGLEDTYFTAVALPPAGGGFQLQTWNDKVVQASDNKEEPHIGMALGGQGVNRFSMFVGPKDVHLLKSVDPKLEQVVDFGWFWFLARPLFDSLNYINDKYIHNYGWSIVVLTVIINILLLPLKISNIRSMKKMSALQPQINAISAKYKDMSMKDPRRQKQQEETMALYQQHGVNPLGGCAPMLLQMPFLFAFYKVLSIAIEMRGASWLWVTDLSQPETLSLRILPLATLATQFLMQKMTPTTTADPQQQRIMMIMPLMFIPIFWNVASGLVLYWLTGNVVGIVQQWFFNRLGAMPAPVKPAVTAPATKKKTGK